MAETEKATIRKSFSREEWAEIIVKWESGEWTLERLAEHYDRGASTLSRKLKAAGIEKGSRADEFVKETRAVAAGEKKSYSDQLTADFRAINKESGDLSKYVQAMLRATLLAVQKDPNLTMGIVKNDILALKAAQEVVTSSHSQRIESLGVPKDRITDEASITKIAVGEFSAAEIAEIQRKQSIKAGYTPMPEDVQVSVAQEAQERQGQSDKDKHEAAVAAITIGTPSKLVIT